MAAAPFIEKALKNVEFTLRKKGFKTIILKSEQKFRKFIYDTIPDNCVVGLGSSLSNSALKIRDILLEKGNKVYFSWNGNSYNRSIDTFEEHLQPDYFLTSAGPLSQMDKKVNIELPDGSISPNSFPKHIIAFSGAGNIMEPKHDSTGSLLSIQEKPFSAEITIAIIPFLKAS
jgi:hypothetical protein